MRERIAHAVDEAMANNWRHPIVGLTWDEQREVLEQVEPYDFSFAMFADGQNSRHTILKEYGGLPVLNVTVVDYLASFKDNVTVYHAPPGATTLMQLPPGTVGVVIREVVRP